MLSYEAARTLACENADAAAGLLHLGRRDMRDLQVIQVHALTSIALMLSLPQRSYESVETPA